MFEYKNEVVKTTGRKLADEFKTLETLMNERSSEGWEFVCHSMSLDAMVSQINVVLTFRKQKN
ncbi:MAG: hypothetical protein LBE55_05060 [Clostridiales bacterium]|jgi:hypothetical protein|nr:hypothetical protein [Clostridiales bacterium]